MKALLLQRASQQGEIELPLELYNETEVYSHIFGGSFVFRVMQGGRLSHIFTFCCSNFVGLFDTGDQSHIIRFTLFIVSCLVSTVRL